MPPWGLDRELDPRLVEELGLTRRPSAIALLTLDRRRTRPAALDELVELRALQQAAVRHCRQLDSCLAAPLEDAGVVVALSLDEAVRGRQHGRRIEALVRELQRALARDPALPALLARPRVADREERLASAIAWLERHLDAASPLEDAARRAGLAPSSFRREFRQARGQSFGAWLRSARIDAAAQLLAKEELPVVQVARRVGFGEVHAFIRNFRARLGSTPASYRRSLLASV